MAMQLGPLTSPVTEPVTTPAVAAGTFTPVLPVSTSSPAALLLIARQVGEGLKAKSSGIDYHIDMVGGMPRIRIIDKQTLQIIRQIPSDEVLTIHQAIGRSDGVLLRQTV